MEYILQCWDLSLSTVTLIQVLLYIDLSLEQFVSFVQGAKESSKLLDSRCVLLLLFLLFEDYIVDDIDERR